MSIPTHTFNDELNWPGWGAFLAASWTWCIGMFLPVLLIRDFGFWGWIVFAIPNVIGAAAMGWVMRTPDRSRQLVENHSHAAQSFSAVTIAFHLFFVVGIIAPIAQNLTAALLLVGGLSIAMLLLMQANDSRARWLAWGTLFISLAMIAPAVREISQQQTIISASQLLARPWNRDLIWLGAVCVFGFAGCPYLDLTFHRAAQQTRHPRNAFAFGFGVLFLSMIVFTLIYARPVIAGRLTPLLAGVLLIHLSVQAAFTIAAHARELEYHANWALVAAAVLGIVSWAMLWLTPRIFPLAPFTPPELIYRVFMGFYGLVFPAYVWLVVMPDGGRARQMRSVIVFAIVTLAAMPFYFRGFVQQQMIWLGPGLGIVLAGRLLIRTNQQKAAPIS